MSRLIRPYLCLPIIFSLLGACATVPDNPRSYNAKKAAEYNAELGATYMQRGNLEQSKRKYDKALEQDPDNARANSGYALLMARLGDHTAAEKYFQQALRIDPQNPEVLNNYGAYLCDQGKYKEAQQRFNQAVENPLYKTPEYALTNAGACATQHGDSAEAEAFYQSALQANPRFGPALLSMSEFSYGQQHYRRAEDYLNQYHEANRATPQSLQLGMKIYRAMGDRDKAADYMLKLKRLYPDSPLSKDAEG